MRVVGISADADLFERRVIDGDVTVGVDRQVVSVPDQQVVG